MQSTQGLGGYTSTHTGDENIPNEETPHKCHMIKGGSRVIPPSFFEKHNQWMGICSKENLAPPTRLSLMIEKECVDTFPKIQFIAPE